MLCDFDVNISNSMAKPPGRSSLFEDGLLHTNLRIRPRPMSGGCGSPVIRVLDHGRHVTSLSPVPLKTRRVEQRCTVNLSRAEMSSRCVVW
ncbi:hypothetical protein TNCV_473671 [Trichonephila clavipes]|nr:hypothetical protein TNCV_473671 [Trichonephila clavipes]